MGVSTEGRPTTKLLCLGVLSIQTASHVLMTRYSRQNAGPIPYLPSVAVSIVESIKLLVCLFVIFMETETNSNAQTKTTILPVAGGETASFSSQSSTDMNIFRTTRYIKHEILGRPTETLKLVIPAGLYTLQNNLLVFALSKLDSATYQVCYQTKILTTAMFSVILLNKKLRSNQWFSLLLLFIGVALVQLAKSAGSSSSFEDTTSSPVTGFLAIIAAACTSGFSGVYFEMLVKHTNQSLWIRNLQMAIFGCLIGWCSVFINDSSLVSQHGLLQGFNWSVWTVISLGVASGFMVALVVKYADNILKGFAVSISIILSSFISFYFLDDFTPSFGFLSGTLLVLVATFLYGMDFTEKQNQKQ